LHRYGLPFGLQAYGIWRIPKRPHDYRHGYLLGKSVFIHPGVRAHFTAHIEKARELGPNVLARLFWVARRPFTITEAMHEMRPTEEERWVFDLLREHGIRDGLYCPVNGWVMLYWSPKVLRLALSHRGFLFSLAMQASMHLDEMIPQSKENTPVRLSARERTVLHYLSNGVSDARMAHELGIGEATIRTYVRRALKKLGVKTRSHATAEAVRQLLVK
jgi:DNA-binding CsgD family transcriptional regulator